MTALAMRLLAAADEADKGHNIRGSAGNVVFLCVFFLAAIVVLVWWLRR